MILSLEKMGNRKKKKVRSNGTSNDELRKSREFFSLALGSDCVTKTSLRISGWKIHGERDVPPSGVSGEPRNEQREKTGRQKITINARSSPETSRWKKGFCLMFPSFHCASNAARRNAKKRSSFK